MFIIYIIDLSIKKNVKTGSYFYKNQKRGGLEKEKKVIFSYFNSKIPNFSYTGFFKKCSMFRRSTPLKKFT